MYEQYNFAYNFKFCTMLEYEKKLKYQEMLEYKKKLEYWEVINSEKFCKISIGNNQSTVKCQSTGNCYAAKS